MKNKLKKILVEAIKKSYPNLADTGFAFNIESTEKIEHGDYATNAAMQIAKLVKNNPRTVAATIVSAIADEDIVKIDIAGPGFINFHLSDIAFQKKLAEIIQSDEALKSTYGGGKKVMVEFVSANPTGPLHIGHGRGAAVGDSIANVMQAAGFDVHREYYVNDAGNQMNNLAASIYARYIELYGKEMAFPQDGYKGDYIVDIAEELKQIYGEKLLNMSEKDGLAVCKKAGIKSIMANIRSTLKKFEVTIDEYYSEASLYEKNLVEKAVGGLDKSGGSYEKDGALWLNTTAKGDEKDRVLKKSDGSYTYLMPDVAYHQTKYERGYELLIDVVGADHHGYVKRMHTALEYLGHREDTLDYVLVQMMGLVKSGERMVMSTRAGEFITLDWLIDEVGVDAARFFYNMRSASAQFDFDIDLAKSRSSDNPVYYVQYAHARVKSLLVNALEKGITYVEGACLDKLTMQSEKNIIKKMTELPSVIQTAAQYNEPHRVAYYLQELAGDFHSYYYNTVILDSEETETSCARLNLAAGVARTIKFGLGLLGVSAPERM